MGVTFYTPYNCARSARTVYNESLNKAKSTKTLQEARAGTLAALTLAAAGPMRAA